eukprot:4184201-Amphidinium_carterae.1
MANEIFAAVLKPCVFRTAERVYMSNFLEMLEGKSVRAYHRTHAGAEEARMNIEIVRGSVANTTKSVETVSKCSVSKSLGVSLRATVF